MQRPRGKPPKLEHECEAHRTKKLGPQYNYGCLIVAVQVQPYKPQAEVSIMIVNRKCW